MRPSGVHPEAAGDLVEEEHRADLVGDLPRALEEAGDVAGAADRLHDDGRQLVAADVDDLPQGVQVAVGEGMGGAGEALGHAARLEAGEQMPLEPVAVEIHREVPVVPAVVAAEGDLVPAGGGTGHAHRLGHNLPAAAGVTDHVRPGVELEEQLGQRHFLRGVEGAHRPGLDRVDDRLLHVGVGVAQRRGADADHGEVQVAAAVEVPHLAALGLGVVGRPQVGEVHLRPLAEQLRPAGQDLLGARVQPLAGAVLELLHPIV